MSDKPAKLQLITELMKNPYYIILMGIGLIVFVVFVLPFLATIPHVLIAIAFFIIASVIIASSILSERPLYKGILALAFIILGIISLFEPTWIYIKVPDMIGGLF